jgi:hypothetical protein
MLGIAKLLFGDEPGKMPDWFAGHDDAFELAEQARRAGEWCGSTPGRGRRLPREVIVRDQRR